ncbi:MAG: hypothetical protein ACE37F_01975 [Nannocystaceae bacterium]|nr:hypothetical protein [bacterium]
MPFGPPQLPPDPPAVVEPAPAREPDTTTVGGLEFGWSAPEGCGSADGLAAQVERYLAQSGAHTLRVDATAEVRDSGWHLSLSMTRPGQTTVRELDAPSCEMLTKAAALVIAVHVDVVGTSQGVRELVQAPEDFLAVEDPPPADPAPVGPPAQSNAVPTTVAVRSRRPADERRARRRPPAQRPSRAGVLRLVTHGGVGERPGFFGGVGLAGGYQLRTFRIEAQLDYAVPRVERQGDIAGAFQSVHGVVRGCWVSGFERWEFPLCGGVRAGGLRGIATAGAEQPSAAWSPWVGLGGDAATVWSPIPDFGIYAGLGVMAALRRPSFRVGLEDDPLYTSAPVALQLNLGVELKLF